MKKINIIIGLVAVMIITSCSEYLDVVPDNTLKLENIFATKEDAWDGLAKCYTYLPNDNAAHESLLLLGDETIGRIGVSFQRSTTDQRAERIMRGLQSTSDPVLGTWSGTNGGKNYFQAIRSCNVFLQYVDGIRNLSDSERADWRAQVTFLKAYYHFLLLRQYGPVIISDNLIAPDALSEDLYQKRSKVEDVFDYILGLLDTSISSLPETRPTSDLGMIDRVGALAIKARILLYRASPFFSGNREFFDDFLDPSDGERFFATTDTEEQTKEKWANAITAINAAITLAEAQGKKLSTSETTKPTPYLPDSAFFRLNPDKMKKLYDLRFVVVAPWNEELIWGNSNVSVYSDNEIADMMNIRLPQEQAEGIKEDNGYSQQWLAASYQMAERYYTANGLPIDEDLTFNYNTRLDLYTTPGATDPDYPAIAGLLQPNTPTVNLYMNREMRFYANLDITGGYVRTHYQTIPVYMMATTPGGLKETISQDNFLATGIGVQKMTHPESMSGAWQRVQRYPMPIIRLADLYLMKAEALNEYKAAPDQEVWDAINLVRRRAGIPDVEDVWSDPSLARTLNKHTTQSGMRDIILTERSIELAFEGSRFWDMWRHKRAHKEFNASIQGWNYKGTSASTFFVLGVLQPRRFIIRDYLWPIDLNELNTNANISQNPGW
ncbi:MAG: RagB/SusD family nutrient uptake outer membrane protein [Bacteroidales bacterium]|jgi:hypothetical protein|nr:RagB/SusD family nutrient uptake outer membrane protein [Bacteroidales bacterium]